MWALLLVPVAASLYSKAKTGSFNPLELLNKGTPIDLPLDKPASASSAPVNVKVDGHGTGLLDPVAGVPAPAVIKPPVGGVPVQPVDLGDVDDPDFLSRSPEAAAAAAAAARLVQQQQSPEAAGKAAGAAAEATKIQIMEALNTPEGQRTPEQLALLLAMGSLPTT